MKYDIGIIGLGSMGSMAMWQLARRGASVIGFEQFGIGHDRSAAGGETRIFRTAYKEGPQYVPLLKESIKLWRQLEQETGKSLLTLNGGLTIGNPEEDVMKNVLKSIKDYEIKHEILNFDEAERRYPQHRLLPDEIMVLDQEAGFIRPEHSVVSAVTRAEELGAIVHRYTAVDHFEADGDGMIIRAGEKEYKVGQVIISAGPWVSRFAPQFQPYLEVRKIVMSWFPVKDIQLFSPDQFPVFTRRSKEYRFFGVPSVDNSMVKLGMSTPAGRVENPDQLNRTVSVEEISDTLKIIPEFFRGFYPDPIRVNAYMDVYTPDDHSIVGRIPELPNVVKLSGFSGHGFKFAPIIGKIAAEILLDGTTPYFIDHLNPARFTTSAGK